MATVEEGSLARCAEREGIAPSSISRRISDLEARCGVALLERRDRGVQPTAAGEKLFARARTLMEGLEQMVLEMEAIRGGSSGQIRIHAHASATLDALPTQVANFLTLHPDIDIEINELTTREVMHSVRTGIADIGFVPNNVESGDLHFYKWKPITLVVVLPQGHALTRKRRLNLNDLLEEHFIAMQRDSDFLVFFRQRASMLERTLKERVHATSFEGIRNMVAAGLGVSVLPDTAAYPFEKRLAIAVRPLDEPWTSGHLFLCVRDPQKLSAAATMLVDYLQSEVALSTSTP
jgi:DNA-binding transcriptional LysR family regulator